jgi:hypothetical protein
MVRLVVACTGPHKRGLPKMNTTPQWRTQFEAALKNIDNQIDAAPR